MTISTTLFVHSCLVQASTRYNLEKFKNFLTNQKLLSWFIKKLLSYGYEMEVYIGWCAILKVC